MSDNSSNVPPSAPSSSEPTVTPEHTPETFQTSVATSVGTLSVGFQPSEAVAVAASAPAPINAAPTTTTPRLGAGDSGTDGAFFNQLTGIPIEYLVATPLIASARANMALAQVMAEFIDEIGFSSDGSSGGNQKTRLVEFELTREIQDPVSKKYSPQTISVQAPLLALVPIPALLIQSVDIDLTVEISQAVSQNSSTTSNAQLQVGAQWGWGNASFTGSFSTSQANTRSTNQSAKYEVRINARQQPLPEGMSRLMDVFASTITPIPASSS